MSLSARLARQTLRLDVSFHTTSCSWANAVETFFANRYLGEHNRKPKPFIWTANPDHIIEKLNRGHQLLASNH